MTLIPPNSGMLEYVLFSPEYKQFLRPEAAWNSYL